MLRPSGESFYDTVANNAVYSIRKEPRSFSRMFDTKAKTFYRISLHVGDHCVFHRANAAFIDRVLRAMRCGPNSESKETPTTSTPLLEFLRQRLSVSSDGQTKSEVHRPERRTERSFYHLVLCLKLNLSTISPLPSTAAAVKSGPDE